MGVISPLPPRFERPLRAQTGGSARYTDSETVALLLAGLATVSGLIHVGAAVDHFAELPLYTFAFALVAAGQFGWAALLLRYPTRVVLLWGSYLTACVILVWIASRTVGVPIGSRPWRPEPVGVADLVESGDELLSVIAALALAISPARALARRIVRLAPPVIVGMLALTVLYGVGAHAG